MFRLSDGSIAYLLFYLFFEVLRIQPLLDSVDRLTHLDAGLINPRSYLGGLVGGIPVQRAIVASELLSRRLS
jgi:hypothetical protein